MKMVEASGRMRITKHHHACVVIDDDQTRILVDPGQLGPRPLLDGVDAVLVTHGHFDHFDPDLVSDALDRDIPVWAPADVVEVLGDHLGLHEAVNDSTFLVDTLMIQVAGNRHAEVHPHIAGPPNRAYLINGSVFVTGDEHPLPPDTVSTLVTPIDAPWLRATDLIRYVRTIRPTQVIGIHDGLLNEHGVTVARHCAEALLNEGATHAVVPGDGEIVIPTLSRRRPSPPVLASIPESARRLTTPSAAITPRKAHRVSGSSAQA